MAQSTVSDSNKTGHADPRRKGRRRLGWAIASLAVACASVVVVPMAPAAAASSAGNQQDWFTLEGPDIAGSEGQWMRCDFMNPDSTSECRYALARAGSETPEACAVFRASGRVGRQELWANVPTPATAGVYYRIFFIDAYTGDLRDDYVYLRQHLASGWTLLGVFDTDASKVVVQVCDHDTTTHFREQPRRGHIGIDTVRMRCVERCEPPAAAAPLALRTEPSGDSTARVEWTHGSQSEFPRVGYRVRYSRDAVRGHSTHGNLAPWSSRQYIALSNVHYSPVLLVGLDYRVEITAVDSFGRESPAATTAFVHMSPACELGPHDFFDSEIPEPDEFTSSLWDLRDALDWVGIVDPTGLMDAASAMISIGLGEWDQAALSAVAIVPYVGDTAKVPKLAGSVGKTAKRAKGFEASAIRDFPSAISNIKGFKHADLVRNLDAKALYWRRAGHNFPDEVNGYWYRTDAHGRVTRADGILNFGKAPETRGFERRLKPLFKGLGKEGDEVLHIMGRQFGGRYQPYNLVPGSTATNRALQELEEKWAKLLRDPTFKKKIRVQYDVKYSSARTALRPDVIEVRWWKGLDEQEPLILSGLNR